MKLIISYSTQYTGFKISLEAQFIIMEPHYLILVSFMVFL